MPKLDIIIISAVTVVVIGGAVVYFLTQKPNTSNNGQPATSQISSQDSQVKINDPNGDYKLFSDASVTKHPEKDVKFGNGQVLTFEYDGSKTDGDPYATLSYQLYYIDDKSSVHPIGGGNIEGKGSGEFKTAEGDKVFNSSAANRPGFLELLGTYGSGVDDSGKITGKNVKLGMYAISFDVSE